ncbi:MAG: hypothetical protein IT355_15620 [Gemmatimonadaceae bacterium]|nr:hypothetical protein [Gemmatimonadaceae bacterium]
MFRHPLRRAAATLLVLTHTACSGGGDGPTTPPATPTATLSVTSPTSSIVAGATAAVGVTLVRGGGFTGPVTVTAASLPTGVTSSAETIAAGATSATLTLTAAPSAPAATSVAVTVTGSASGVSITPRPLALSVTGGNGAVIALATAAGSIEAGTAGSIIVTLTRTGTFNGTVNVSVTGLPAGVTAASQSLAPGVTSDTIPLSTTLAAAAATTTLTVAATGSGITIAPQTYALTTTHGPIAQLGNDMTSTDGQYGSTMALNADGTRIVVGAYTSTNGTTRVYERTGTTWTQMGTDIIGEAAGDRAGVSVAINAAGTRIAVGAYLNDDAGSAAGQVRVYDFVGGAWTQVGADIDGGSTNWGFGWSVALSGSGSRLVASATSVGGVGGWVTVYDLVGSTWTQVGATLNANNEFGDRVDISSDGTTIAAAEPSAAGSSRAGTVHVYRLVGSTWTQLGNTLQGEQIGDAFGAGLALTATGSRIVVGAPQDTEGGTSGGGGAAGKLRIFDLIGSTWTQVGGDILGSTGLNGDGFGEQAGISDDGTRVAANGASQSVARVYTLTTGAWTQTGPTITSYGTAVRSEGLAVSADGRSVSVGYVNGAPRIARVFRITP